jgi:hypothetical protein
MLALNATTVQAAAFVVTRVKFMIWLLKFVTSCKPADAASAGDRQQWFQLFDAGDD